MSSLWYCCGCNFGPHNSALYDACINCGTMRCSQCVDEKVANRLSSHSHANSHSDCCQTISPYPSAVTFTPSTVSFDTRTMPSFGFADLPQIRPLSRRGPTTSALSFDGSLQLYSATYMYVCCQCNDGPKVYNVQPQCVNCNHMACNSCIYVK